MCHAISSQHMHAWLYMVHGDMETMSCCLTFATLTWLMCMSCKLLSCGRSGACSRAIAAVGAYKLSFFVVFEYFVFILECIHHMQSQTETPICVASPRCVGSTHYTPPVTYSVCIFKQAYNCVTYTRNTRDVEETLHASRFTLQLL